MVSQEKNIQNAAHRYKYLHVVIYGIWDEIKNTYRWRSRQDLSWGVDEDDSVGEDKGLACT